ncbi:hypothetical protein BH20ACT9_BH20ACT9_13060 [soil metagenome]
MTDDQDTSDFFDKRPPAEQVDQLVEAHPVVVAAGNLAVSVRRAVHRTGGVTPDELAADIRQYADEANGYVRLLLDALAREADQREAGG